LFCPTVCIRGAIRRCADLVLTDLSFAALLINLASLRRRNTGTLFAHRGALAVLIRGTFRLRFADVLKALLTVLAVLVLNTLLTGPKDATLSLFLAMLIGLTVGISWRLRTADQTQ
jgi:hypothetical protein